MTNIRYACDFRQPPQPQSKSLLANKISKERKKVKGGLAMKKCQKRGQKTAFRG